KELSTHLKLHRDEIAKAIRSGSYISQPILGVEIPKDDGTQRLLGVPKLLSYYLFTVCVRNVFGICTNINKIINDSILIKNKMRSMVTLKSEAMLGKPHHSGIQNLAAVPGF
ncbi:MAG: hypothetical protein JJE09_16355, partial [Bacteroidia bacterium]|nr:hypothetical protein [Bacteroidia bacterium]